MQVTPESRDLLQNLMNLQLLKNLLVLSGTQDSFNMFVKTSYLSLPSDTLICSRLPNSSFAQSVFILHSHQHLYLPIGLIPSSYLTRNLHEIISSPTFITCVIMAAMPQITFKKGITVISKTNFGGGTNLIGMMIWNTTRDSAALCFNRRSCCKYCQ